MGLLLVFAIGAFTYLLTVAWSAVCYRFGEPKGRYLTAVPGPFAVIMMLGAVASKVNELGLIKNPPEALLGFLTFVTVIVLGIPGPWLLGWGVASALRLAFGPARPRRRADGASKRGEQTIGGWLLGLPEEAPGKGTAKRSGPRRGGRGRPGPSGQHRDRPDAED